MSTTDARFAETREGICKDSEFAENVLESSPIEVSCRELRRPVGKETKIMSADTIANMLSSVKNATLVKKGFVEVPHSKMSEEVAKVLESKGFLKGIKVFKESGAVRKRLRLDLVGEGETVPARVSFKKVSKQGSRIYRGYEGIKKVPNYGGILIVSTSQGMMASDEAIKRRLGGEVVCLAYHL